MTPKTVPLHSNKPLHVLWGLFRRGPLEIELGHRDDKALVRWEGGSFGGEGAAWLPRPKLDELGLKRLEAGEMISPSFDEDPGSALWLTLLKGRRDESMLIKAIAVVEVAFLHHRSGERFCLERVAEVLHGPRSQRRSHRERETKAIAELVRLFMHAEFILDGSPAPSSRRRSTPPGYTGLVEQGPLLSLTAQGPRYSAVKLHPGLYRSMSSSPYEEVDPALLSLRAIPGHANPDGNGPSKAQRVRYRLGMVFCARAREAAARRKAVQAPRVREVLGRWAGLEVDKFASRRRLRRYEDGIQVDAEFVRRCGGPQLVAVEAAGVAGDSLVRLALSPKASQRTQAAAVKHREHDRPRRPPVEATRSGRPGSHSPP